MHRIKEDVEALLYGSHHARLPLEAGDTAGVAPLLNALMQRYQETEEAVQGRLEAVLGALSEDESRLEELLNGLSEGVVEYSAEGLVVRYNQSARSLFAAQGALGVGLPVGELIDPEVDAFAREELREQLAREVPHPFTTFTLRRAGSGALQARIAPLLLYGGRLAGYVLTVEPERMAADAGPETETAAAGAPLEKRAPALPCGLEGRSSPSGSYAMWCWTPRPPAPIPGRGIRWSPWRRLWSITGACSRARCSTGW